MEPLVFPQAVIDYSVNFERKATQNNVAAKYTVRAQGAFDNVLPVLATLGMTKARAYLDIGCGNGTISALMARDLGSTEVHLIDGSSRLKRVNSFTDDPTATPWNDVSVAHAMVAANMPADTNVQMHFANPALEEFTPRSIDLITSFRSWGHHYPVSAYTKLADHVLTAKGLIMLDIRSNKERLLKAGLAEMKRAGFRQVVQVEDHSLKCMRFIYARN